MTTSVDAAVAARLEREFLKLHRKATSRRLSLCARATVLPTTEFFPGTLRRNIDSAEAIARILAERCGMAHCEFHVREVCDVDAVLRSALPRYVSERAVYHSALESRGGGRFTIHVLPDVLGDSKMLTAQLVRHVTEIALKDRLHISVGRASRAGFLIDLASVYLGFGIFTANGAFEFQKWSDGWKYEWVARRSGSLSEAEYGHLLAVYAAARGEKNPGWARHLDGNVRVAFRASEKELQRTQRADALKVCG